MFANSPWTGSRRSARVALLLVAVLVTGGCNNDMTRVSEAGADTPPAVAATNRPPEARKDAVLAPANDEILVSVLGNDYDPDGDVLAIVSITKPEHGTTWLDDRGTDQPEDDIIRYQAATGFSGLDSFSYLLSDSQGGEAEGLVVITVGTATTENRRPVATLDSATTIPGTSINLSVLDNDADPDGDVLTLVALSPAAHGLVQLDDGGTPTDVSDDRIVYTPEAGFTGTDRFVYTTSDGQLSASASVLVEVGGAPAQLPNLVSGHVIKGPVRNATISLYPLDARGNRGLATPVATAITDQNGFWSAAVPDPDVELLVVSSGGAFDDENGTDQVAAHTVELAQTDEFETVIPANERYAVLTLYTNAMLAKARTDVQGDDFASVFERARAQFTDALGFDPLATAPANPATPNPATGADAIAYAQVIGAAANALNGVATGLDRALPNYEIARALIRDLSDCRLDAQERGAPIDVRVAGSDRALPVAADLNLSVVRFRNNRAAAYAGIEPAQIDLSACTEIAEVADSVAPVFDSLPAPLVVQIGADSSIPSSHPQIASALAAVTATDDRDGPVPVINNAPAVFPVGQTTVRFTATDAAGNATSTSLSVTVANSNAPPAQLGPIGDRSGTEDVPLSINLGSVFTDPDGNPLGYTLAGLPAGSGLTLDALSGQLDGSPTDADAAASPMTLTLTASDGEFAAIDTFVLTITAINDEPLIAAQAAALSIPEDGSLPVTLADLVVSDPDNTFPADFSLAVQPGPNYAVIGNTVTPTANFAGPLNVAVMVSDGVADSAAFNLVVNVVPVNDVPQILSQAGLLTALEDGSITVALTDLTVVDPDNAFPGDFVLTLGTGANYTLAGTTITPDADFSGTVSVPATVNDGLADSNSFNLLITVTPVNDAPVITATASALVTDEDTPITVDRTDLIVSDPDNVYPTDFSLALQPGAGYGISGTTVNPAANFSGLLSVPATVNDGLVDSAVFVIQIAVTQINDPPVAVDDALVAPTDRWQAHVVLANDSDIEGDALSIVAFDNSTTQGGTVTLNDNGTPGDSTDDYLEYLSASGYVGNDNYTYTVSDGTDTATATVSVAVSVSGFVSSVLPADSATDVSVDTDVSIQFSEAMNVSTITVAHVRLSVDDTAIPTLPASIAYDPVGFVATIDPTTDLAPGTTYYVTVEASVENAAGDTQGFRVQTQFITTGDADNDGLSTSTEVALAATVHPCLDSTNADSDGDGLGDGLEVETGSDPCFDDPSQVVYLVDEGGPSAGWPGAIGALPPSPTQGTPGAPTMILIADGVYLDRVNLSGSCDNIVYAGSLDPAQPGQWAQTGPSGRPTTLIDMDNGRNSELSGCGNVELRNVELSRGIGASGGDRGGGLRASGGTTVLIDGVWMTDNTVNDQGGGLGVSNAATVATVRNSVFMANTVTGGKGGGGIWVGNNATLDIADSRVLYNVANGLGGGGIFLDPGATATIHRVTVAGNFAPSSDGGGVEIRGPGTSATVTDSVISGNLAFVRGGGIDLIDTDTNVRIDNNLLIGNYSSGNGGAIHSLFSAGPWIRNSTVVFNQASNNGGAVSAFSGEPVLRDNIFYKNRLANRTLADANLAGDTFASTTQVNSNYNLVEMDADGGNDIDLVALARSPDFIDGFYVEQPVSLAVDSGSRSAAAAGLDAYTTARDGTVDTGTVDRGFHLAGATLGPPAGVAVVEPASGLAAFTASWQGVVVQPLNGALEPLGRAQEVFLVLRSAPANFAWEPIADIEPLGPGSVITIDEGNGNYRAWANTNSTGSGLLEFDVVVNGVNLGTTTVPINP